MTNLNTLIFYNKYLYFLQIEKSIQDFMSSETENEIRNIIKSLLDADFLNLKLIDYYELKLMMINKLKNRPCQNQDEIVEILLKSKRDLIANYMIIKNNLNDHNIKALAEQYQDHWILNYTYKKQYDKNHFHSLFYKINDFDLDVDFWKYL